MILVLRSSMACSVLLSCAATESFTHESVQLLRCVCSARLAVLESVWCTVCINHEIVPSVCFANRRQLCCLDAVFIAPEILLCHAHCGIRSSSHSESFLYESGPARAENRICYSGSRATLKLLDRCWNTKQPGMSAMDSDR